MTAAPPTSDPAHGSAVVVVARRRLAGRKGGGKATEDSNHLDHDHETGKLRGALCGTCIVGIRAFVDSPERLRAAVTYLEKHA